MKSTKKLDFAVSTFRRGNIFEKKNEIPSPDFKFPDFSKQTIQEKP
jgi:hypothetical protein